MNNKRGLKRLAVVLGVPYFGWWAFLMFASPIAYRRASERFQGTDDMGLEATINLRMMVAANANFDLAITWGIIVPVIVLIIWQIARWVYRGFRSDQANIKTGN